MTVEKVEVLDKVNYFGLIEGEQIMYCTDLVNDAVAFLWCLEEKNPIYKHSALGEKYYDMSRFEGKSNYIAEIECLPIKKRNLDLWKELFNKELFPFWDPKDGPYKYHMPLKYITLCRVYETNLSIVENDFGTGQVHRLLYNPSKIKKIEDLKPKAILSTNNFTSKRDEIIKIVNFYNK